MTEKPDRDLMERCPHCGRKGQIGSDRVFEGEAAYTMFKCHNCDHVWRIPDEDDKHIKPPKSSPL
jgi:hypothetical protein